jgi:CubicO group peptidase (beta-lactamase class C family)
VPGGFHVYPEMAAAGLWTTPSDLGRWAIALTHSYRGETGSVLSTTMARQMISKQMHQQPPFGNGYWGLGVGITGDADSLAFVHNGRDEGFVADLTMWPNRGRGIVIMMNGVNGGLMTEIERAFAEEYRLGGPTRIERTLADQGAGKLAAFRGRYMGIVNTDTIRADVAVTSDGTMLTMAYSALRRTILLAPVGGDAFVGLEGGGEWHFERDASDPNGPVRALVAGIGPNRRVFTRQ